MEKIQAENLKELSGNVFENLGVFAIVDADGKYVYASKAWKEEAKCEGVDVIGMDVRTFYPETGCIEAMKKRTPILGRPAKCSVEGSIDQYTSYFPIIKNDQVLGCTILTFFRGMDEALHFSDTFKRVAAERDQYKKDLLELRKTKFSIDNIIGESPSMLRVKNQIRLAAASMSNVLIEGETGTGKELVSQSIHELSKRSIRPLIKLNCAAIPEGLAESELFGYEGGAFTGANKSGKLGKFELANGGTLFLDEINQLSQTIQPKLLRALQEREIERVGGVKVIPVDIRLIAATNVSLEDMIEKNKFREDLYYRLNVINIRIPPLRERPEDIPLLVLDIIERLNQLMGTNITGVADDVIWRFQEYSWPGNIRELQNIMERIMNEKLSGLITWKDAAPLFDLLLERENTRKKNLQNVSISEYKKFSEKKLITDTLRKNKGNKKKTAEQLGISRTALYNKLNEYNIAASSDK